MDNRAHFEGLSLPAVQSHFETYTTKCKARGEWDGISRRACIVIDHELLRVLADAVAQSPGEGEAVDDARNHHLKQKAWWVRTVEAWPDLEELTDDYDGR
ncbi:hypothetical protein BDW75DRAFT_244631 [Aspergillus navahoensis]